MYSISEFLPPFLRLFFWSLQIYGRDVVCTNSFWDGLYNLQAILAVVDNYSYLSRHTCISNFNINTLITLCWSAESNHSDFTDGQFMLRELAELPTVI